MPKISYLASGKSQVKWMICEDEILIYRLSNDTMASYETGKYFNAERYEMTRYCSALDEYHRTEDQHYFALSFAKTWQATAFNIGLLAMYLTAAHQIFIGQRPVGQFVTLATLLNQLQRPLENFARFYGSIQTNLINAERMLKLFREKPIMVDEPGTKNLQVCNGDIVVQDAVFTYMRSDSPTSHERAFAGRAPLPPSSGYLARESLRFSGCYIDRLILFLDVSS